MVFISKKMLVLSGVLTVLLAGCQMTSDLSDQSKASETKAVSEKGFANYYDDDPSAIVYTDANYSGTTGYLKPGYYSQSALASMGIPYHSISSIKVPRGIKVALYENNYQGGNFCVLTEDSAYLGNQPSGNFNDKTASIVVYNPQDMATLTGYKQWLFSMDINTGDVYWRERDQNDSSVTTTRVGYGAYGNIAVAWGKDGNAYYFDRDTYLYMKVRTGSTFGGYTRIGTTKIDGYFAIGKRYSPNINERGLLIAFAKGRANNMLMESHQKTDGTWTEWTSLGIESDGNIVTGNNYQPGYEYCWVLTAGRDGRLIGKYQGTDGSWNNIVFGDGGQIIRVAGNMTTAKNSNGPDRVFFMDRDTGRLASFINGPVNQWYGTILNPSVHGNISAAVDQDGLMQVYFRQDPQTADEYYFRIGSIKEMSLGSVYAFSDVRSLGGPVGQGLIAGRNAYGITWVYAKKVYAYGSNWSSVYKRQLSPNGVAPAGFTSTWADF